MRPAAICDVATLTVFAGALAGDPATAASLGCPVRSGHAVSVRTQQMRAGWLIDPGRPGPIYAVFAAGWWQALAETSIGDILTLGAPPQLGVPQGPVLTSGGFLQSFEGGTMLTGPDGSIVVLFSDGRTRSYVN